MPKILIKMLVAFTVLSFFFPRNEEENAYKGLNITGFLNIFLYTNVVNEDFIWKE